MTLSPTVTSSGTRLPLSSMRPGPVARTSPSWGFSLAVSGMTRPEAVVCSASMALTTIRSSRGLMLTDTVSTSTFPLCREFDSKIAACFDIRRRGGRTPDKRWHPRGESANANLALVSDECQTGSGSVEEPDDKMARVDLEALRWLLTDDGQRL